MKKLTYLIILLLLPPLFTMCDPSNSMCLFFFVNNSSDTVGTTVFKHCLGEDEDEVICVLPYYSINPSDTARGGVQYDEAFDTWKDVFDYEEMDTLYFVISKSDIGGKPRKAYKFSQDPNILKIYKLHAGNFDLKTPLEPESNYPVITYP